MGFYKENLEITNRLRARIDAAPEEMLALWRDLKDEFTLFPRINKRLKVPECVPEELREWYATRGFYVEKPIGNFDLIRSPALAEEVKRCYKRLTPLYRTKAG